MGAPRILACSLLAARDGFAEMPDSCETESPETPGISVGIFALMSEALSARHASHHQRARKGKTLGPLDREEIRKTIIHRALETSACVIWDVSSLSASSSVNALGILAAFAAPLHRPGVQASGTRAVLYVDVRDPRKHIEKSHVELFMSAALLIGALTDQRARGESDRARLGEALSHTETVKLPKTRGIERDAVEPR